MNRQAWSLREVAEWSGISFTALRRMYDAGTLPGAIPQSRLGVRRRLVAISTFAREMGFGDPFEAAA